MEETKNRSLKQNLLLALLGIPITTLIIMLPLTLIGALDDLVTKIQRGGNWWILIIAFCFIYFLFLIYEPKYRINRERDKIANALLLYLKDNLQKHPKKYKSIEKEETTFKNLLLERFKIWAWQDPKLWNEYYPDEKYSKTLFGIVDNFIVYLNEI